MKLTSTLATILIAVAAYAVTPLVHAHAEHGMPQHGGIYGEAGTFQAELVIKDAQATLYLSNHGEALSAQGASGKLIIMGADGKRSSANLAPAAGNQLVAKLEGKPAAGSKIIASVVLPGRQPANIRYAIE